MGLIKKSFDIIKKELKEKITGFYPEFPYHPFSLGNYHSHTFFKKGNRRGRH